MTHNQKTRGLQIINHILGLVGLSYVFATGQYYWLAIAFAFFVPTTILGINIGFHRLLSHASFTTYPYVKEVLSLIGSITTIGSPLAWTAVHRQHHKHTETPEDPHSPYLLGNWKAWFGFWDTPRLNLRLVKDLRKDPFQKFLHKHYVSIIVTYCILLALINPLLVIFGYAIPSCLTLHASSSIIVIAHRHGYKTHNLGDDEARNSWIANITSLGEGWHNNHHAMPWKLTQGIDKWQIDPPAWIIKKFLAKDVVENLDKNEKVYSN